MATPTDQDITSLLSAEYGVKGSVSRLAGENDNHRVDATDGQKYVLKFAGDQQSADSITLEHLAVEAAVATGTALQLPRVVRPKSGELQATHGGHTARLLTWVEGTPWGESGEKTDADFVALGRAIAELDNAFASLDDPVVHRTHRWDLANAQQHRDSVALVEDEEQRRMLEWSFHFYEACAHKFLPSLPHSLIHGDANDENILVANGAVAGLLDFGDALHNPTICELAITATYAMLDQPEPLRLGALIVQGYHSVRPLSVDEVGVLFPLVCGRMAVTVSVAAQRRQIDPDHPDWFETEPRAWAQLERFYAIDPIDAARQLAANIDVKPLADGGAPLAELLEKRDRHIGKSLSVSYNEPIKMIRGSGQYLYDATGRPFLDMVNNVCHVGHCHPRVVEAGQRQMARLNTNSRYVYDGLTDYAERIVAKLPDGLDTCFFVNSGSEANELALRIAMTHTGRQDFLVVDGAYHGHTARLIDISPYKFMGKGGAGAAKEWVHVVPIADGYRGEHKGHTEASGTAYAADLKRVMDTTDRPIAGFISESILSCGGQVYPPPGYFKNAFEYVRAAGALCIMDEVQVGFGRMGEAFWGFELQDVVPDMVVLGKPIGNGHPMGAVVTTKAIADSFANGMEFFSTFGGNPVSCAIGQAVLDVIESDGLQENAAARGKQLVDGLRSLQEKYEVIGEVRGVGLFVGIEFVHNRDTLEPAADVADKLVQAARRRGILLSTDGPLHNVIKIKPPMVLTADDIDMVVRVLDDELDRL